MTDEEVVRAGWDLVAKCDGSYRDYPRGTIIVQDVNNHWFDFPSWEAARKFTEAHAEKIRQVREEIEMISELGNKIEFPLGLVDRRNRTYQRLQADRDDLLKGWRQ